MWENYTFCGSIDFVCIFPFSLLSALHFFPLDFWTCLFAFLCPGNRNWYHRFLSDMTLSIESGEIPSSLGQLTKLTKLHMHGNFFGGVVSQTVAKRRNLRLSLSLDVDATGEIPVDVIQLISSMKSMQRSVLLFGQRAATGFRLPTNIGNLEPTTRRLDVTGCSLTGTLDHPRVDLSSYACCFQLLFAALSEMKFIFLCSLYFLLSFFLFYHPTTF